MPNWKYSAVVIVPAVLTTGVVCACLYAGTDSPLQSTAAVAGEDEQTAEVAPAESEGAAGAPGSPDIVLTQPVQSVNGEFDPDVVEGYFLEVFRRPSATGTVLGVHVSPASAALRKHLRLPAQFGLLIEHVEPGSAAAAANLERFDVLYRFDDQMLVNQEQLTALVRIHEVDDRVPLTLYRAGEELQLEVVLQSGSIADGSLEELDARTLDASWLTNHMANPRFQDCRECHEHPFEP